MRSWSTPAARITPFGPAGAARSAYDVAVVGGGMYGICAVYERLTWCDRSPSCCQRTGHGLRGVFPPESTGPDRRGVWYDCQAGNTERLALGYLYAAVSAAAICANYLEATGFLLRDGEARGLRAVNWLTGGDLEVRARTVVNATDAAIRDAVAVPSSCKEAP